MRFRTLARLLPSRKQDLAGIRGLQVANLVRIEVVKAHASQAIVERAELGQAGGGNQEKPVVGGRGERFWIGVLDLAGVDHIELVLRRASRVDAALLPLDLEAAFGLGADPEGVVASGGIRQGELEADAKVGRMAGGTAPDLVDAATFAERMIQGGVERFADEAEGVQEVALAGAVLADQKNQRLATEPSRPRCSCSS